MKQTKLTSDFSREIQNLSQWKKYCQLSIAFLAACKVIGGGMVETFALGGDAPYDRNGQSGGNRQKFQQSQDQHVSRD